ncbi:urease accessory protein UreD [Tissierella sp.]|uniref:urease accessory protein UreD n=1 Tax=Tissierella sp. TaxID=41274 RepID=UPI0028661D02|nr:urease accessory protein UreD [Tissierella sp.]MDR7855237.1 urease accessory protein UreD [Tissierella sp.]
MGNSYKNTSKLNITTKGRNGKTIIEDVYFTTPFKITRPFYEKNGALKIVAITVSAGILEGDVQEINIKTLEGSNTIITSQSYEKIHKMKEEEAKRNTDIYISKNAFLKYIPLPTIPFANSAFSSKVNVELEDDTSKFIISEIIACGRYSRGEIFQYKYFKSLVDVRAMGKLLYRDNTFFKPKDFYVGEIGMLENYTHLANILIFNFDLSETIISEIRDIIEQNNVDGGVSYTWSKDVVIRILGFNSQSLERISERIIKTIEEGKEEKKCI